MDSDTGPEADLTSGGKSIAEVIGQDKPSNLEGALGNLPPKWKNWVIRGVFTWLMIGGFGLIIYGGPLALMLTVSYTKDTNRKIGTKFFIDYCV